MNVKATSEKGAGDAINQTMNGVAERPAEDCSDRDVVAQGDGEVDG